METVEIPKIEVTTDYSIFKFVNFNRDKSAQHINEMVSMIKKENLLHLHPILVNNNMEVIDGQHRLKAAEELHLPVYYIKSNLSYNHILNSNLLQKKLNLGDVVKFYAIKDRNHNYIELRSYSDQLGLSIKALIGLLFGSVSKPIVEFMKDGKFQLPSDKTSIFTLTTVLKRFVDYAKEKRFTPMAVFTSSKFTIGFRNMVLMSGFDEVLFFKKLEMRWFELRPQITSKEWTRHLIADIYNFRNQNPLMLPQDE